MKEKIMDFDNEEFTAFWKEETRKKEAAFATLESFGYTYTGGTLWKPPLGERPSYLEDKYTYVTFNTNKDLHNYYEGRLTHNKDYKAVKTTNSYQIVDDCGITYSIGKSFFYDPKEVYSQETIPDEDDSFEGLIYVEPKENVYIKVANLTEEQKLFLDENLKWLDEDRLADSNSRFTALKFVADGGNTWFLYYSIDEYKEIFFNDIYVKE